MKTVADTHRSEEESEHFPIESLLRILNVTHFCIMADTGPEITKLLHEARSGNKAAENKVIQSVYPKLHEIAKRFMGSERKEHTLQPTALVNEAYLKIFGGATVMWSDRVHFMSVAAQQMRKVLADHGRAFRAAKRGGGIKIMLNEGQDAAEEKLQDLDVVEELLARLEKVDPVAAEVTVSKYYGGMTDREVADSLGTSHKQVRRHWDFARAWMKHQAGVQTSR